MADILLFKQPEFDFEVLTELMFSPQLKPIDTRVVFILYTYHTKYNGVVSPSRDRLAKEVGCTVKTLKGTLTRLKELGVVDWVERKGTNGVSITNQYFLQIPSFIGGKKLPPTPVKITPNIYTIKPMDTMDTMDTIKLYNNSNKGVQDMKQKGLFRGAPEKISKRGLTDKQLYEYAREGKVELNYTEFIRVYEYVHRLIMPDPPQGKKTAQEVKDTLTVLVNKYGIPYEKFWVYLPQILESFNKEATIGYVSFYMLRTQKQFKDIVDGLLDTNKDIKREYKYNHVVEQHVDEDEDEEPIIF